MVSHPISSRGCPGIVERNPSEERERRENALERGAGLAQEHGWVEIRQHFWLPKVKAFTW